MDGRCPVCLIASALDGGYSDHLGEIAGHELVEEIARGGMGVVYRARQQDPEREVALKSILGGWLSAPDARERFRLEVKAMASLEHPAILPVYQVGDEDGVPYFTMKLAEGGTLSERHAGYAGKWREIATLLLAVAEAVRFAHEHGVLHRDLKPGNILFDSADRVFVSDFGMAKLTDSISDLTLSAAMMGTPHYLAPEIAAQSTTATISSDVWSLGVVLYELLAQVRPFNSASVPSLLREIVERDPPPLAKSVPTDLAVIAMKALAKDPARRYSNAGDLAEDLRSWLEGRPIKARPVSSLEKMQLWVRRNPAVALAIAVAMGTLVVAGALLWKSNRELRHSLAGSLVAQAALARTQAQARTRSEVVQLLQEAIRMEPGPSLDQLAVWRSEAVAALALPAINEAGRLPVFLEKNSGQESFSADFSRFAAAQTGGCFGVFKWAGGSPVRSFLPPPGDESEWRDFSAGQFRLSPNGKTVAAGFVYPSRGESLVRVYDVESGNLLREIPGSGNELIWPVWSGSANGGYYFGKPGEGVAFVARDGTSRPVSPPGVSYQISGSELCLRNDGRALAALTANPAGVAVWDLSPDGAGAVQRWFLPMPAPPTAIAWSPDGSLLALGESDLRSESDPESESLAGCKLLIVGAESGEILKKLPGHTGIIVGIAFSGDSVLSLGHDERLIWQSLGAGFRLAMPAQDRFLQVSPDGKRLACSPVKGMLATADLTHPVSGRLWPNSGGDRFGSCLDSTADGRTLVVSGWRGLQLWEGGTGSLRQDLPWPAGFESEWPWFQVEPDGGSIIVSQGQHPAVFRCLWQFPLTSDGRFATPRALTSTDPWDRIHSFSENGKGWIVGGMGPGAETEGTQDLAIWPDGDPAKSRILLRNVVAAGLHVCSPDGSFGISASQHQPDAHIWDLSTGKKVRSLGYTVPVTCIYAPDRRTVAVISPDESALWDTATWRKRATWVTPPGGEGFTPHFSPDGKLIGQFDRDGHVAIHTASDGAHFLTLTLPPSLSPREFTWLGPDRLVVMGRTGELFEWNLATLGAAVKANGLFW